MHQSINVNADGIIVPAALHCAAALTHTGTERQRPGAGMYDWARMATKEGRAKNRTFFFFLVAGVGSKYVGKVQNGRHCSDHRARWGAALGTCVSRSVQEGHASSKGKGPMDPWSGGCCKYVWDTKLEMRKRKNRRGNNKNEMIDFISKQQQQQSNLRMETSEEGNSNK